MEILIASIIAFAATNIDDIFILMLFFGDRNYKTKDVVVGQFVGVGLLIGISFAGSFATLVVDRAYIGLLGLLPIFLGTKSLIKLFRQQPTYDGKESKSMTGNKHSVFVVASVTIANGGDNIGIYIPLFASLSPAGKLTMTLTFIIMIAIWCFAGNFLARHPAIAKLIDKYGHIITPLVLILLGLYILYESGTYNLIATAIGNISY